MSARRGANSCTKSILKELNREYFKASRKNNMEKILLALEHKKNREDIAITISDYLPCFFDRRKATAPAIIIKEFPKIEPMLYGLEDSYRDHYIHMFNVYLSGSRIISKIIGLEKNFERSILKDFKLTKEVFTGSLGKEPNPWQPFSAIDRIFYVWLLISTFHDLGIVVEKIDRIRNSLNEFLKNFGVQLEPFSVVYRPIINTKIDTYFKMMARFFGQQIPEPDGCVYKIENKNDEYLRLGLLKALERQDHGIISSITLMNVIQETFSFKATDEKYDLNIEKFSEYNDLILKNDISRAAMTIALHNLDPKNYKRLFPIDFKEYPFSYLLILCDELEDYRRWTATTIRPIDRLTKFPIIDIKKIGDKIELSYRVDYEKLSPSIEKLAVEDFNAMLMRKKFLPTIRSFPEVIEQSWIFTIEQRLKKKLLLSRDSQILLKISIYYDEKLIIYRDVNSSD